MPAYAQETVNRDSAMTETLKCKNAMDITFAGSGIAISANYSRKILVRPGYFINTSMGVGTIPSSGGFTIPHQITLNMGINKSHFELGVAGTYFNGKNYSSGSPERVYSYLVSPLIGYRRYFFNRIVFRAYLNPFFYISGVYFIKENAIIPYGGLSIGHSF